MYFKAFGSGTNDLWQTMISSGHHLSIIGRRKMTSPRMNAKYPPEQRRAFYSSGD